MKSMLERPLIPLASLFWGLQFAFLSPSLALILVSLYGATPAEVGWVLACYNAAGFVVSLVVPAWADRRRQYLWPLLVCSVLNLALTVALTLATSLPWVTVALVVFGAPAGVGMSLIFAHLAHGGAAPADLMNNRAIVSFAWVAAPPIATALIGWFGPESVLLVIAAIALGNVATEYLFAHADNDRGLTPAASAALGDTIARAGLRGTSEIYAGSMHGYTMADTAAWNEAAYHRAMDELRALFARTLGDSEAA